MTYKEISIKGGKQGLNCIAEMYPDILDCTMSCDSSEGQKLPLYGMPILVKDNIDVKGLHTTAGSLALDDNIAEEDAPVIANLRKKGAVILGKTNMTEFANFTTTGMPPGYSSRGGQVIHAIDTSLSPGGSSSGSAVAVSAGLVPVAIGTDTSFSIIACAQENGICGLKPAAGTLSSKGIIPIARTLDSVGTMAGNLYDAIKVYDCMREESLGEIKSAAIANLKLAINTANQEMVSEGQISFRKAFLNKIIDKGASVEEIEQQPVKSMLTIMRWEFKEQLEDYLKYSGASRKTLQEIVEYYESNPDTMMKYGDVHLRAALYETPGGTKGEPYLEVMKQREETRKRILFELKDYDAVILTGPSNIMHFCGLPSVCVASNVKNDKGVQRGLIMYGADERRLYSAALTLEKHLLD